MILFFWGMVVGGLLAGLGGIRYDAEEGRWTLAPAALTVFLILFALAVTFSFIHTDGIH